MVAAEDTTEKNRCDSNAAEEKKVKYRVAK